MNNPTPIQSKKSFLRTKVASAFSLVELLVVIAVIGIIAAIAIPNISSVSDQATTAKNQRNAQSIASTYNAAMAAGGTAAATADDAIDAVTTGTGMVGGGNFSTTRFFVPLSTAETDAIKDSDPQLLDLANGQLIYTPEGVPSGT